MLTVNIAQVRPGDPAARPGSGPTPDLGPGAGPPTGLDPRAGPALRAGPAPPEGPAHHDANDPPATDIPSSSPSSVCSGNLVYFSYRFGRHEVNSLIRKLITKI